MVYGYGMVAMNDHNSGLGDGAYVGCVTVGAKVGFCRVSHCGMAVEDVAGVGGGETESGEAAGVTIMLKNGMLLGFPGTDTPGVSCGSTPRGSPGVVDMRSHVIRW